jgi:hypothetical protein
MEDEWYGRTQNKDIFLHLYLFTLIANSLLLKRTQFLIIYTCIYRPTLVQAQSKQQEIYFPFFTFIPFSTLSVIVCEEILIIIIIIIF